jgi:hypothetical protein
MICYIEQEILQAFEVSGMRGADDEHLFILSSLLYK